jgi:hypothetical protein
MVEAGQTDKAREVVVAVLKTDRANPDAWHLAAMLTDDEREKCEALRRAVGLAPDNAEFRELYSSLGCGDKIIKTTQTVTRADLSSGNSSSSMMMALLFVILVIVVGGAGAAFLATGDSDSGEPRRPSDDEIEESVITWLEDLGPSAAVNPAALADVVVVEAKYCEPAEADKAEGITEKWIVDVEYLALEGANIALSGGEIPYTWTVFGRNGDWFVDIRTGVCNFQ